MYPRMAVCWFAVACATAEAPDIGGEVDASVGGLIDAPMAAIDARVFDAATFDAAPTCQAASTCMGAASIGTVSGDTASTTQTAMGHQAQWLSVRVTEDYNDLDGLSLLLSASLSSPPGSNFDLYLYVNKGTDALECTTVGAGSTKPAGETDSVTLEWGEGALANGSDDSRTVSIEVRYVSGPCAVGQNWSLTVTGNPP